VLELADAEVATEELEEVRRDAFHLGVGPRQGVGDDGGDRAVGQGAHRLAADVRSRTTPARASSAKAARLWSGVIGPNCSR
jgi:hypothetical protein